MELLAWFWDLVVRLDVHLAEFVQRSRGQQEITVWDLDIEISDSRSVEFLMAIMRDGKAVSQLGFTPDQGMTMTRADFTAVADRALDRLSDLPSAR